MNKAKYHFAYNENNDIVDISAITEADRKIHKYHCISCGAEMIAKLGSKNVHHFAHKGGDDSCNEETYLHKLGKYLLKKKFDESREFLINYNRKSKCSQYSVCKFHKSDNCVHSINTTLDLKKYFDTCIEEQTLDKFRADLLLSDSSGKYGGKIMLEICVSHECTEEKIKSKHKIIEIHVQSEADLLSLMDSPIEESDMNKFYNFKGNLANEIHRYSRRLPRFYLYSNNKGYVNYYSDCSPKREKPNTIFELIMDENSYINTEETLITEEELLATDGIDYYKVGLVFALDAGLDIKNCSLCKFCRSDIDRPLFCCMSKKYGTPREPKREFAAECHYYSPYQTISEIRKAVQNIHIEKI